MPKKSLSKQLSEADLQQIADELKTISAFLDTLQTAAGEGKEIDAAAIDTLIQIQILWDKLSQRLDDTLLVQGHKLYQASFEIYDHVKRAAEMNVPGAEAIYNQLAGHFTKATRAKNLSLSTLHRAN